MPKKLAQSKRFISRIATGGRFNIALAAAMIMIVGGFGYLARNAFVTHAADCNGNVCQIYRKYFPAGSDHFNTPESGEAAYSYNLEGTAFWAPVTGQSGAAPVRRLYNPDQTAHYFTIDQGLANTLATSYGWQNEGSPFYAYSSQVSGTTPVYVLRNPNDPDYLYTISNSEADSLVSAGWVDKAIAFYAFSGPPASPTVTISASPNPISYGASSTINWSSGNATSCSVSPTGWSGTSGAQGTGALTANRSYTATCSGVTATSPASASVAVTVNQPGPPSVNSFSASPGSIAYNAKSTLSWLVSGYVSSCAISNGGPSGLAASGSWQTPSLTNSQTYQITCIGPTGLTSARNTGVSVAGQPVPPAPPPPASSGGTGSTTGSAGSIGGGTSNAGKGSQTSTGGTKSTDATATPDTIAPSVVSNLSANSSAVGVSLGWQPATDDRGVDHYVVERSSNNTDWSVIAAIVTHADYADSTATYDTHYWYRVKAVDAAGNASATTEIDITTAVFTSNVSGEATIASDDGLAKAKLPDGAVSGQAACALTKDTDTKVDLKKSGQEAVVGPYSLVCRLVSGDLATSFGDHDVSITVEIPTSVDKAYKNLAVYQFDSGLKAWQKLKTSFEKKSRIHSFVVRSPLQFAILGAKKTGIPWQLISFIVLVFLILLVVVLVLIRQRKRVAYNDYIRRKYYNL